MKNSNNQFGFFQNLPDEMIEKISQFLSHQSLSRFSQSCIRAYSFFLPVLNKACFLNDVMRANEDKAKAMLLRVKTSDVGFWKMILEKGAGKEECGRVWNAVSALEYAAWAGDIFMVRMFIEQLPREQLPLALNQLEHVYKNGTEHGKLLSALQPFLEASDTFVAHYPIWTVAECEEYLIPSIGGAQAQLPFNVLQAYCVGPPFNPIPQGAFRNPIPREFKVDAVCRVEPYGWGQLLPLKNSGLGVTYYLLKTWFKTARAEYADPPNPYVDSEGPMPAYLIEGDCRAIRMFERERREELLDEIKALKQKIMEPQQLITYNIRHDIGWIMAKST